MHTSTSEPTAVSFTEDDFTVSLDDGRSVTAPLAWFPRLMGATAEQLQDHFLSPDGIHWEGLDEDISVKGLLEGRGDMRRGEPVAVKGSQAGRPDDLLASRRLSSTVSSL